MICRGFITKEICFEILIQGKGKNKNLSTLSLSGYYEPLRFKAFISIDRNQVYTCSDAG